METSQHTKPHNIPEPTRAFFDDPQGAHPKASSRVLGVDSREIACRASLGKTKSFLLCQVLSDYVGDAVLGEPEDKDALKQAWEARTRAFLRKSKSDANQVAPKRKRHHVSAMQWFQGVHNGFECTTGGGLNRCFMLGSRWSVVHWEVVGVGRSYNEGGGR